MRSEVLPKVAHQSKGAIPKVVSTISIGTILFQQQHFAIHKQHKIAIAAQDGPCYGALALRRLGNRTENCRHPTFCMVGSSKRVVFG